MSDNICIAAVQMDVKLGDREVNLANMLARLEKAAGQGASLVVFPECALSGYCFESLEEALPHAESIPGPSTRTISAACSRLGVHVVFGLLESAADQLFNACVLLGGNGVIGVYRKVHLPFLGVDRFTTPGDRPFAVHEIQVAEETLRIGMNICYDASFPEASRVLALLGADLIVLPTNWPPGSECISAHVIHSRSMENHLYYLAANRVGSERGFRFIGRSKICGPGGYLLNEAVHEDECILFADIDVNKSRNKHQVHVPGKHEIDRVADRRPETYGIITQSHREVGSRRG